MIVNNIKVAFRNLTRNTGYSILNIGGLAVGMSVTMLIGMWMYDEMSYNTHYDNYDRIAQVCQHEVINNEIITETSAPMPLGNELKSLYKNYFKHVVMAWWQSNHVLYFGEQKISSNGTFVEGEALEMFSFDMVKGSWKSLKNPASIVISESTAKAMFGDVDPMDKLMRIDNTMDAKVTGVFKDFPHNSRFQSLQFISTWDLWVSSNEWMKDGYYDWSTRVPIFAEIQPHTTFEEVSEKIKNIKLNKLSKEQANKEKPQLFLQPMSKWHLYSEWKNGNAEGRIEFVWLFGIIGVFVLLLACINFMNMSTAQSERRAKEVGIRKAIGSVRSQLIYQFMIESFLVVVFAFVLTIALVTVALPWFNSLADKRMEVPMANVYFWLLSLPFILITSLLAGSYPSFYLSSFQPVKVLKGTFKGGRFAAVPRKVLVVLQFTVSIALIIGTIIVWQQIQYAKNRPVGYSREGLIMIRKNLPEYWGKFNVLRNELKASGAVVEMAESSSPATETWMNKSGFSWEGKDPDQEIDFAIMDVTHEYGKTMGWNFVQGRDYSRDFSSDSSSIILNESAVRLMDIKEPLNAEITWQGKRFRVIGVIKDMLIDSPYEGAKPTIFSLNYEGNVWINIRINPAISTSDALASIEKVFKTVLPAVPFEYKFTDQEYALKFSAEERVGKLASFFATLSIFISCLGLFGMASFVAEQRRKEIGIRKILGASVANLWTMLSVEFVTLVGVSCLLSSPIAWYFLTQWLQKYEYHTSISGWIFVLVSTGALLITLLTVSFQTIKASIVNPVKSLRLE